MWCVVEGSEKRGSPVWHIAVWPIADRHPALLLLWFGLPTQALMKSYTEMQPNWQFYQLSPPTYFFSVYVMWYKIQSSRKQTNRKNIKTEAKENC